MQEIKNSARERAVRVLHVAPSLDRRYGGPTIAFSGLLRALAKIGVDTTTIGPIATSELSIASELTDAGVKLHQFATSRLSRFQASRFASLFEETDVIHLHGIWEPQLFSAYSACIKHKRPYFLRSCGMLTNWSLSQKRWRKSIYRFVRANRMIRNAEAIHFSSQQEWNESKAAISTQRFVIEPNGYDTDSTRSAINGTTSPEQLHSTNNGSRYILFVGRLHPVKGIDLLLKAYAAVQPTQVELVIAGGGTSEYRQELHKLSRALNIDSKVRFAGLVSGDAKMHLYKHADFFVLPSHHENFGNVVLESLSQATPVIVSNRVALADAVIQYRAGEVCELNVESLAQHMKQLLVSPERIREYEMNASLMANAFQWQQIAQRWAKHYQHALENQVSS
ncbi:glycosyltransferase [Rosistilla oblonga]|uniref:glycosyltransferase n=1 Tax=Rosistilla oblonga TaxID=2527990 RepID=UPI003A971037